MKFFSPLFVLFALVATVSAQTAASGVSYDDSAAPAYDSGTSGSNVQAALDGSKSIIGSAQQAICFLTPIRFYAYVSSSGENDVTFDNELPNNHYNVLFTQIGDSSTTPVTPVLMSKASTGFAFYDAAGSNTFDIFVSSQTQAC
jgi:hypothetical protein